ncbi:unnamed protein product [Ophioblennius macclurei]
MKPIISLALIWTFSATAEALQCLSCSDDFCSSTTSQTCSSETMCITASIEATSIGLDSTERIFKGCATSSMCPNTGNRTFSADAGIANVLASALCCDTDDCNGDTLPLPTRQPDNGGQCFICSPGESSCSSIRSCEGEEDRCFEGSVRRESGILPVFGCMSQSACDAAPDLQIFPLLQNFGTINSGPTCCQGDLCNNGMIETPSPTTPTPLQCLSCSDDSCSSTTSQTCSSETMCITATIRGRTDGQEPTERIYKSCATSTVCPIMGPRTFAMNAGYASVLVSATCCSTVDCNSTE